MVQPAPEIGTFFHSHLLYSAGLLLSTIYNHYDKGWLTRPSMQQEVHHVGNSIPTVNWDILK